MPALLTRMSRRPCFATISAGARPSASASVTSSVIDSARRPERISSVAQSDAFAPRAAAITRAPCSANRAAIARPMPRDAPVTRATLPSRLNMSQRFNGCEIVRAAETDRGSVADDLADQTAQHGAGTYLNIRCDAFERKPSHDVFPPDGCRHLAHQRINRGRRVALHRGVNIRDDWHARIGDSERAQLRFEPVLRRLHERAMKRGAHLQRNHAAGAERPGAFAGA